MRRMAEPRNNGDCVIQADTAELVRRLQLLRHPEGGWYRETYRSADTLPAAALPQRFSGERAISTAIYFLLERGGISALHRIKSDEVWHFYAGVPLTIHVITAQGEYLRLHLGRNLAGGESFQAVVPAGCWFGAEAAADGYSLVGCTVAPGFDFADFEMGEQQELVRRYPRHAALIRRLTPAHIDGGPL